MLARKRTISLSNGSRLQTPLAIPSLSTRNVGRLENDDPSTAQEPSIESYASFFLREFGRQFDEALLVSAYDLHHENLHDSDRLLKGESATVYATPEFLMIDSGLYEIRERVGYDDGYERPGSWTVDHYEEMLAQLPKPLKTAIVNYDLDADSNLILDPAEMLYAAQIARGREFFARHQQHAKVMLLKPQSKHAFLDVAALTPVAEQLREFDIVAVTEKELGQSLHDRLFELGRLRMRLGELSIDAPIHIFGGLDPLLTPLYVACGAELVDGVGWLRYSYGSDDTARYLESRAVLANDIEAKVLPRLFTTFSENLTYLRRLNGRLRMFASNGQWMAYSPERGMVLEEVCAKVFSDLGVK